MKNNTVFKDDLTDAMSQVYDIPKATARDIIDTVFELIASALVQGTNVKINNFFNFFVRERKAKDGVNPITKEPITIPAVTTVHAKMTKPFKDRIQGKR